MASSVQVFIYDLSHGLARTLSFGLLGKQIDGIWHTGIVAYGKEFFFGGSGIESCAPGGTILGRPNSVVDLGSTEIPYELFYEHLQELSQTTFRPTSYHLLHRNCNNFSSEIAQFLTGRDIPPHITNLPDEVLSTPFGQLIKPMLDSMTINPGEGTHPVFGESITPSHRVITPSTSSSGLNSTRPDFLTMSVTFTLNKSVTSDSIRPSQEDVKVIEELLNIIQRNDPSAVTPLHLETLDKILTARISSSGESSPLWCIYQILFCDPWITQVSRHIGNMRVFSHFSTESIESLKALCNLCSTAAGYSVALNKAYGVLKNLPSVVSNILASADLLDAAASTILNVSIQHKASDDLDVPYAATLSDFFTSREVIAPLIAEKFLIGIYNLMSKNDQTKELVYALGVSSELLTNVAASTQNCKEVIKLIDKMK